MTKDYGFAVAPPLRALLRRNAVLFKNSAAMATGSLIAAALGFVYWWYASRSFPAAVVGLASANISIMGFVGMVGEAGLGILLVGDTLLHRGREQGLIAASLVCAFFASGACGLVYVALVGPLLGSSLGLAGSLGTAALFIGGCALTGVALVLDQAYAGLLRSSLAMYRNAAFSVTKLAFLPVMAAAGQTGEQGLVHAWVIGLALSVVLIGTLACRAGVIVPTAPDFGLLARLMRKVVDHHLLNVVTQAPALILPLLVSLLVSPAANAVFYPAWMVIAVAALVPAALTGVVYTVGMSEPEAIQHRLRVSLAISAVCALATAIVLLLFSQTLLAAFNPAYPALAGSGLGVLGFGLFGIVLKHHYIAVIRLQDRMRQASLVFALAGGFELALAAAGIAAGGLEGLVAGWVVAQAILGAFMLPPVLNARRWHVAAPSVEGGR
jgi:O-antigen/teichoic acid export membrane protein